jgi:hypothetical protein
LCRTTGDQADSVYGFEVRQSIASQRGLLACHPRTMPGYASNGDAQPVARRRLILKMRVAFAYPTRVNR